MLMFIRGGMLAAFLILSFAAMLAAAVLVFGEILPTPTPVEEQIETEEYGAPQFDVKRISFSEIDGWRADSQAEALPVFLRSCERIADLAADAAINPVEALGSELVVENLSGIAADWRRACAEAERVGGFSYADEHAFSSSVRVFFETSFVPFQVLSVRRPASESVRDRRPKIEESGTFTGYFEPTYDAFSFRTEEFSAPLYARPDDLVMVDLGAFREELAGERIAGSVSAGRLKPYPDHKAINAGVLEDKAEVMAWLRPTDLLFLQIQGSGRLQFRNGDRMRVGYDGQNGHPYTAVGKPLIEMGEIPREEMSMQAIRDWLDQASPEEAQRVREMNASYVFFRELTDLDPGLGPLGATEVQLTPGRSLAVDRRYHALGAPIWVSIDADKSALADDVRRLFVAQDTGGAIRGPVRGDLYIGSGAEAGEIAGALNSPGEMVVLLPVETAKRLTSR